jgi:selenobiotic family peptide radical SAM maturase
LQSSQAETFENIFSKCRSILGIENWGRVQAALENNSDLQSVLNRLSELKQAVTIPNFIGDLARLEWAWHQAKEDKPTIPDRPDAIAVNPSLNILPVSHKNLAILIASDNQECLPDPEPANAHVMIWRHPKTDELQIRETDDIDILALKIVVEDIDPREAAADGKVSVRSVTDALDHALKIGILISPGSRIRRGDFLSGQLSEEFEPFLAADIFTLQWHITQACDLHCKHCYDRSDRTAVTYDTASAILDDFYRFCRKMNVKGQVTFTGGNPLLYPRFEEVYKATFDRGFGIAILGNPTPNKHIERLLQIAKPLYFQISLEGLEPYNDYIRGKGHFKRSLKFLEELKRFNIYTMVMLTLTRDNIGQVVPLAKLLNGKADSFNFNRLSTVGEGAQLLLPMHDEFEALLREYEAMAASNTFMGLKDNLINLIRREKGLPPFGGCTGFGCGAAFNFVALLPDGEVHACRKFPSPIGNIMETPLMDIYHCEAAKKYRNGSQACQDCSLAPVCRGCFASAYSYGLNVFKEKDPFCFLSQNRQNGT